jgi:hypothetical protein
VIIKKRGKKEEKKSWEKMDTKVSEIFKTMGTLMPTWKRKKGDE